MFRERNSCTVNKTMWGLSKNWIKNGGKRNVTETKKTNKKINKNVGLNLSIPTISNLTPLLRSDFVSLKLEMCSLSLKMTLKCFRFCCGRFKNLITEFLVAYFWLDRLKKIKINVYPLFIVELLPWLKHGAIITSSCGDYEYKRQKKMCFLLVV